jgi:hypothetical protein
VTLDISVSVRFCEKMDWFILLVLHLVISLVRQVHGGNNDLDYSVDLLFMGWQRAEDCNSYYNESKLLIGVSCELQLDIQNSFLLKRFENIHNQSINYDSNYLFEFSIHSSWLSATSLNQTVTVSVGYSTYFRREDRVDSTKFNDDLSFKMVFPVNKNHRDDHILSIVVSSTSETTYEENLFLVIDSISLTYLVQVQKLLSKMEPVVSHPVLLRTGTAEEIQTALDVDCQLLGTTSALVLNLIEIHSFQISYDQYVAQRKENPDFPVLTPFPQKPLIPFYPKILCSIFTISTRQAQIDAIYNTWGRKCSQIIFFSNHSDPSKNIIPIYHYGEESHGNMFQKTIAILKYLDKHYIEELVVDDNQEGSNHNSTREQKIFEKAEFDWFLIGGDDFYVIMENLLAFIQNNEGIVKEMYHDEQPLYFGRKFIFPTALKPKDGFPRLIDNLAFVSGGSGYLLNIYSIRLIMNRIMKYDVFSADYIHAGDPCLLNVHSSDEDYYIANCLYFLNVFPFDTTERVEMMIPPENNNENGGQIHFSSTTVFKQRFHTFVPGIYYQDPLPDYLKNSWYFRYDNTSRHGKKYCCAVDSISFHQIDPAVMQAMEKYLYSCPMAVKYLYYDFFQNHEYYHSDVQLGSL